MAANRIDQIIDSWSPKLRKAFLDSIYRIRSSAQIDNIAKMLEAGDVEGAIRAVGLDPVNFRPFDKMLLDAFEAGGTYAAKAIPVIRSASGLRTVFQFNVRNPRAEAWLTDYSSSLVKEVLDDQRKLIRQNLTRAMEKGINPRTAALDLVGRISAETGRREGGVIGLTSTQEKWVSNYADALEGDTPTDALTYALRDKRFDSAVLNADETPLTGEQIDNMVTSYTNRALRYRAENIARTEAQTSLHQSQQEALRQAVDNGVVSQQQVQLVWKTAHDAHVRDAHIVMDGQIRNMGEPFTDGDGNALSFPGDPLAPPETTINCRCFVMPRIDFFAGIV